MVVSATNFVSCSPTTKPGKKNPFTEFAIGSVALVVPGIVGEMKFFHIARVLKAIQRPGAET
jgi:hypothetical protein